MERFRAVPVLMLTARIDNRDREQALESGANDFLAKPFSVRELMTALRDLLGRAGPRRTTTRTG